MRKTLLILSAFLIFSHILIAQISHLSLIYDFDGEDFDYAVRGMHGTNDSLYVISYTPDRQGMFFRIDENGEGFQLIWKFDNVNYEPFSMVGSDTAIYITTYATPTLFKYSLKDYSFKLVKQFNWNTVSGIQLKYVTDTALWFTSQGSPTDLGSVFRTDKDGNNLTKVYTATSHDQGTMPSDIFFHENKMYIACWGGGELYPDAGGTFTYCGSFIRMNKDGSEYENIIPGSNEVGTQPQSIVIRGDKMFGLFAYGGNSPYEQARFFSSKLDGTDYIQLGSLPQRALTRFLSTDSLIYGISLFSVFGINPVTGEVRISEDLLSNPDFGADVVSNPTYLNGNVYITAQQGGPNNGGTILRWTNEPPAVSIGLTSNGRLSGESVELDLNTLFTDANGDEIEHEFRYNSSLITMNNEAGIITLTPQVSETVEFTVIARDGWAGYGGALITLNPFSITALDPKLITGMPEDAGEPNRFLVYPNPAYNELKFSNRPDAVDILSADGKVQASYRHPGTSLDISALRSGMYFVRSYEQGKVHVQKLIKR